MTGEQLLRRLRAAIRCPIDWKPLIQDDMLFHELRIYWHEIACDFQADHEMSNYSAQNFIMRGFAIDIRAIEQNATVWRPRAINEYESCVGFFRDAVFKDASDRQKHHLFRKLTRQEVVALSQKRKESFFFPEVDEVFLTQLMWCALAQRWRNIVQDRPKRIFLESEAELGISNGIVTKIVLFDIDYSQAEVHGHPRLAFDTNCSVPLLTDEDYDVGYYDQDTIDELWETIEDDIDITELA